MSITAIERPSPEAALYICWLGAALLIALMTGILRPRRVASPLPDPQQGATDADARMIELMRVLTLVMGAIATFSAWVLAQVIFSALATLGKDANGQRHWPPQTLVIIQLFAPLIAWCVGYAMLRRYRDLWFVGYARRRLVAGVLAGTLGILVAMPFVQLVGDISLKIFDRIGYEHPLKHELLTAMDESPGVRMLGVLAAVVAAPMFEEMLFRGFVQTAARRLSRSPWVAIGVSSILFTVVHPSWTMPPIFVLAVLLGLVYERTHNLWATTVMHALFNAIAIVISLGHFQ